MLYQFGSKFHNNGLILYCKPSLELQHRIGIIVSKKTGNSVVRNKFKRRMRELIPSFMSALNKPHDCIFIATNSQVTNSNFSALKISLQMLFKNLYQLQHEQTA